MTRSALLIISPPADPHWNMAIDELMLRRAAEEDVTTLRFYRWQQPSLSLGYFQKYADRKLHTQSLGCSCVRRSTGGGAILHDHEVTYSYATPAKRQDRSHAAEMYQVFHETLCETLAEFACHARMCPEDDPSRGGNFLCFQRRSSGDVLLDDWKIAGSAQRRFRGGMLQHGSVMLATSSLAPQLPGIFQLRGTHIGEDELIANWLDRLGHRLGLALHPTSWPDRDEVDSEAAGAVRRLAVESETARQRDGAWIQKR